MNNDDNTNLVNRVIVLYDYVECVENRGIVTHIDEMDFIHILWDDGVITKYLESEWCFTAIAGRNELTFTPNFSSSSSRLVKGPYAS